MDSNNLHGSGTRIKQLTSQAKDSVSIHVSSNKDWNNKTLTAMTVGIEKALTANTEN